VIIHDHPIGWYVDKLRNGEHFSQGMYGDAEWICIFHRNVGGRNAENTIYTPKLCQELRDSLDYRSDNFYFSTPEVVRDHLGFGPRIDRITQVEFVEKDRPWDVEARLGGLVPFIQQLQKMKTCIISNKNLRRLTFLNYYEFIEVSYPNCFPEIERVINQARQLGNGYVYLISAGLPAALIAQALHVSLNEAFAIDVGSIWDAFVRIGAQRGWRRELYADNEQYKAWRELYREVLDD